VKEDTVQAAKHLRPVPAPPHELEGLFREHYDRVYRAAYRITGSKADAEDVLQTVFLRLAGRGRDLDLSPNPASYLHRAAINASLDLLRNRTRSKSVSIEEMAPESLEGKGLSPEAEHVSRELHKQVRSSVACLGQRAAEVVALKYFEGYGNREIADTLGISQMVVPVILHRARGRLRKEIGKFLEVSHHEAE
jgi:RNA polymerase sigma factor (sigma-70 family)